MSNTETDSERLLKERFEVWWKDEGMQLMKLLDIPVGLKHFAWIAWSNGAYVALSIKPTYQK